MSNNLVSQYPTSDRQVVQMEQGSEMPTKMEGHVPSNPESQRINVSNAQEGVVEPLLSDPRFNTLMGPRTGVGHNESRHNMVPNPMPNNMPGEKTPFPVKRKAEVEQLSNSSASEQLMLPNKRPTPIRSDVSSLGFGLLSPSQRKTSPGQSRLGSPAMLAQPLPNKKMVRGDSISGKSALQKGQAAKRQTVQIGSASKVRPESSEGVRSKMRESLASSLALAFKNQDNAPMNGKNENDTNIPNQPLGCQTSNVSNSNGGGQVPVSGSEEVFPSNKSTAFNKINDCQVSSAELPTNSSSGNGGQAFQGFQYGLPDEDVPFGDNFFAKDDLLQGNGLSWAFDFDVMGEVRESQHAEKPNSVKEEDQGHRCEVAILTPENLAAEIEAELFKLFGDANKKYKEKGRSLIFNLKDRNNPELRERVMSGEISPERLCSMSGEELASKELSEWRMAKAEEFAQMKVLPDTEVDIRRLVRKTHKGEYQVEVERDDGISAEVSGGASVLTRSQPKKEVESHSPSEMGLKDKEKPAGQGSSKEGHDLSGSLIIPTDGIDLMQGMMVDELKDTEFLPPIVSLDEFMESLNNEPPFENLSADAGVKSPISHGESPKHVSNSRDSNQASDTRKDTSVRKAAAVKKHDVTTEPVGNLAKHEVLPRKSKADYMWDGILQLTLSSSVTVGGVFQSGEKTSTKEWPASLEIKGRVRLDAFEKFLQDLPMSRTRAVMILNFVLMDESSEEQRSNLSEAVDSYITDERLGYAEPVAGVELYLCPPASRMFDMLNKFMPKLRPENDDPIKDGLIGVVVWRRPHISNTISPNSLSHHKNSSKKQPFAAPKRAQDSSHANANTPTRTSHSPHDDDDDIPPGFGPAARAAAKDDDDLPEFTFSGNLNLPTSRMAPQVVKMTARPVDEVRELIKKYGQSSNSVNSGRVVDDKILGIEPWNDDEDDDIPEWRPQPPHQPPYLAAHGLQQPVHFRPSNQHMAPVVAQQPPAGFGHRPVQGGVPPGHIRGPRWRQY